VLTRIVLWWSAFTSLTGVVSGYVWLVVVRFCFGMGEAGAYPNASVVIARWIPSQRRARAWGIVWMTSQIGAALSPLIVVPIQVHYGWRASFMVFGFLGVIWAVAWYAWFRDSPGEKTGVSSEEFGNYNAPFIPMVLTLCVGAWLWLTIDPSHQLFAEPSPVAAAVVAEAAV
jgi:MFS family permease